VDQATGPTQHPSTTQSQSPRLHRSTPPPPAPSPDTRLAAPSSTAAATATAESGFSASQLSPLEFNFRPMDGADALANGIAVPCADPATSSGRTLSRHPAGGSDRPATHGSTAPGIGGTSGPGRGPSSLPHIGTFLAASVNLSVVTDDRLQYICLHERVDGRRSTGRRSLW